MKDKKLVRRLLFLGISIVVLLILILINHTFRVERFPAGSTLFQTATSSPENSAEEVSQTPSVPDLESSPTPLITQTLLPESLTSTASAQNKATLDAAIVNATQRAVSMSRLAETLYNKGYIQTKDGSFFRVKNFDESFAKSGWYQKWTTEYEPENFILRTDVIWNSASDEASWPTSGCGFVFAYADPDNMFRAFLNLDGTVRIHRMVDGEFKVIATDFYSELEIPEGHAQFVLIVEDDWLTFIVNNNRIVHLQDEDLQKGVLSFAIASGTNYSYGTRCQMNNVELWVLP